MALRNYSNTAIPINLTADIDSDDTVLPVTGTDTYPNAPFIAVIERGEPEEEVILVTAKTSNSFTATRGYDGSPASAHADTAPIEHVASAIEYREANAHVNDRTIHWTSYTTAQLPATGNVEGEQVWDSTVKCMKFWTGTAWCPVPGTLLGLLEITSNRAPAAAPNGITPSGCVFTFAMPTLPAQRRVRLEFYTRNIWYDRGDRHAMVIVELRRNVNNAKLAAQYVTTHSKYDDANNDGVCVVAYLDNNDIPAGGNESVKLVLTVDDGGVGFQATATNPTTFTAMVV